MSEKFRPLNAVDSQIVSVDISLPPHLNEEQIGMHVSKVETMCRLGGIKTLRITGKLDQETSSYIPEFGGMDSGGNIYAAKTGVQTAVPVYNSESTIRNKDVHISQRWVNGVIEINLDEVAARMANDSRLKGGVNSPENWAHQLDGIVKNGVGKIGRDNLTKNLSRTDSLIALGIGLVGLMDAVKLLPPESFSHEPSIPTLPALIVSTLYYSAFLSVYNFARNNGSSEDQRRLSLFFGPQYDRALILKFLREAQTVVSSTESRTR